MTIETAALSDPGRLRAEQPNEDMAYASAPKTHDGGTLLILADGVGGMPGGREASTGAVEVLRVASFAGDPDAALVAAFAAAADVVGRLRSSNVWLSGAGTTLVAAYLRAGRAWLANVGDSRAYLIHRGEVTLVTHDHSYVQSLVDAGELTREAARTHRLRNVLARVVGGADSVPDVFAVDLRPDDLLILCSDGLWGSVSEPEIARLAGEGTTRPVRELAQALVEAANAAGSPDNISVVLARTGSETGAGKVVSSPAPPLP